MKNTLGRGLDSLIPVDKSSLMKISTDLIIPNPDQPRTNFNEEALEELALSIKQHGIIEPIVVKETDTDRYTIIAGERRFRAACKAGLDQVPAVISDLESDNLELAIIENIQREDLNAIELAKGYQLLIDRFNYTHEDLAKRLGISRANLSNVLRLLNLSESIQTMLLNGEISYGAARALLHLKDKNKQEQVAKKIKNKNLSVRSVERLVKQEEVPKKEKKKNIFLSDIQDRLSQLMDTSVKVTGSEKRGKIQINYSSLDQLNKLLSNLGLDLNED